MPYDTPPIARQLERGRFNRFLAILPPHDFSLLAPHLRTVTLERGVMLHEAAEEVERVYFPHRGMARWWRSCRAARLSRPQPSDARE
jgi:hypothetical protein